jgi:anti-sigma factor RsiW
MNCIKAEEQFSAYIEDELDYQAVRAFEAHLTACESCHQEFRLFRESLDLLHQLPQIEPSGEFDIALQIRLADIPVESIPFWQRVLRPLYGRTRLALSGIAVLLVMITGFYFYQKTSIKPQSVEIVAAPEPSRRVPLAEERRVERRQQLPLAIPSRELQSLINFPGSSTFNLQPLRRTQQPQQLEQNYILQTVNYTEAPTGGGL